MLDSYLTHITHERGHRPPVTDAHSRPLVSLLLVVFSWVSATALKRGCLRDGRTLACCVWGALGLGQPSADQPLHSNASVIS